MQLNAGIDKVALNCDWPHAGNKAGTHVRVVYYIHRRRKSNIYSTFSVVWSPRASCGYKAGKAVCMYVYIGE